MRAARWLFPGAWQAGTAVLLLSLTDSRISLCLDQICSPRPRSINPTGSFAYWDQGLAFSCSKTCKTVCFSLLVRVASQILRSAGFASLRNSTRSWLVRPLGLVEEVSNSVLQFIYRNFQSHSTRICPGEFNTILFPIFCLLSTLQIP